jgi:hypothetical protein
MTSLSVSTSNTPSPIDPHCVRAHLNALNTSGIAVPEPDKDLMDSELELDAPSTPTGVLHANRLPTARDVPCTFVQECSRASVAELCSSLKVPR